MEIRRIEDNEKIGEFINREFTEYAVDCEVALNFEEFTLAAEDDGKIAGIIIGRAYYNEVHIGDLMNYPHRLNVGKGFCYAAERHELAGCSTQPAKQGMSTMPLSHWLTFGNTFLKMFAAPFMSAFVIVPS